MGDSALPGHPVRVGGSGAGNNFEMSPLLSHEQMKDSIITLDYVSIKLFQLKSYKIERQKLSKLRKLANQPPLEAFVQPSGEERKMISIPIGEIYAQVAKLATSYYSLIVLPLTNFTLHPLTCCVIDKGIKGLV